MDDLTIGLLLAFDHDDEEFSRGFELGRVWAILRASDDNFDCEMHAANAEMILRIAEATDRQVRTEELGSGWVTAYFSHAGEPL